MKIENTCTFKITQWDETPISEYENGAKLTLAKETQDYTGDWQGSSEVQYLMDFATDGTATYVGFEHASVSIAGKKGTFVIQHIGTYDAKGSLSNWTVVGNSGTGDLVGIKGQGSYYATGETVDMHFSLEI